MDLDFKKPSYLVIVMKDESYFSLHNYDSSEWWYYNKIPTKPKKNAKIESFNIECDTTWPLLKDF